MQRRKFLTALFAAAGVALAGRASATPRPRRLIQESPLAGFQYHTGERLWNELREGNALDLVREPGNPYDPRAVRVDWKTEKLGYLPRIENTAVSQMLDRGERLTARIARLRESRDPWERLRLSVELEI
jgi:hypothetical protein